MNTREAVTLIEGAVPRETTTWADVGAGEGTFTKALAQLLGARARLYAVDRDERALATLRRWAARDTIDVRTVVADFTQPLSLPEPLDGMLLANALHFVREADVVLGRLAELVRASGRIVIVEYDRRAASRWVPHPIDARRLPEVAAAAGLGRPTITSTRPSAYGGTLYVATLNRP